MTHDVNSPVAILDKEVVKYPSYRIEMFELCDRCGARFAIGIHRDCGAESNSATLREELPKTLREMLTEDHSHDRKHRNFAEIWTVAYSGIR